MTNDDMTKRLAELCDGDGSLIDHREAIIYLTELLALRKLVTDMRYGRSSWNDLTARFEKMREGWV